MIAGVIWVVLGICACDGFVGHLGKPLKRVLSSSSSSVFKEDAEVGRFLSKLDVTSLGLRTAAESAELAALREADVCPADTFYEATLPRTNKRIAAAASIKSMDERIAIDVNFFNMMNLGFARRLATETNLGSNVGSPSGVRRFEPLQNAAQYTSRRLELGKSKDEQLRDLKKQRLAQRSGVMKMIPQGLHKYIDYLNSLKVTPKKSEITKNMLFGAFFAFVTWVQQGRQSFMFMVVGHLIILSSLLSRNMPRQQVTPGMDRNKRVASWSRNAFKTAAAITILFSMAAASIAGVLVAVIPMTQLIRLKLVMMSCLISTSYFASYFEVYEEKSKNGWRWKKAIEGNTLSAEDQAKLSEQVFGESRDLNDKYKNSYDPEIDDYPPLPKYLDELENSEPLTQGGSGELDEDDAKKHFDAWSIVRKEARRPPVEDAPPETPWIGGKAGMYVKNVPSWLNSAYQKNVLGANAWRDKPLKFIKDTTEFEPVPGPFGFRDKRPQWIQLFGTGVWEEKTTASRRAARAFGSYRKSMWKIDREVLIKPCDGVELD